MSGYFVWVAGMGGPSPQKWHVVPTDGVGKPKPTLARHALTTAQMTLSIDQLATLFPAPSKVEEVC